MGVGGGGGRWGWVGWAFHKWFYPLNSNTMEILFCSKFSRLKMITAKFFTAFIACMNILIHTMAWIWTTTTCKFFWIWIVSVKVISEKGAKRHWFFGWLIWAAERKCSITQCNCCNFGWVSWQLEIKCSFDMKVMCLFIHCGRSCP